MKKPMSRDTFWSLSLTWGIIMTAIGFITTKIFNLIGCKTEPNLYGYRTIFGKDWGGLDLGPYCIVSENAGRHVHNHEFGHAVQNCFLGPLFPFVVAIPSACRYWHFQNETKKGNGASLPGYDDVWYEGQATKIGYEYEEALNAQNQG